MINEWRPIETAPKDGKRLILFLRDEGVSVTASWRIIPNSDPDESFEGWWYWNVIWVVHGMILLIGWRYRNRQY
jgi:hypothetical protein